MMVFDNLKKNNSSGFMLAEVLVVVLVIGLAFSSLFLLEWTIIRGVKSSSGKISDMILLNNSFNRIYAFLRLPISDKEEKIKEAIEKEDKKNENVSIKYEFKKLPERQETEDLPDLELLTIDLAVKKQREERKVSDSYLVYKPEKKAEKKE